MDSYKTYSDEQLVQLLNGRDELAFEEIYERYWEQLYVTATRKLADKELAKEIVQDILFDVWKRRGVLEVYNLQAYLNKAVKYKVLNALAKKNDSFFFDLIEIEHKSFDNADKSILEKDMTALVASWIDALPEKRRQIFVRYYFNELSTREIAKELNLSHKTVQNQVSISLQYLRSRFSHLLGIVLLLDNISQQ